MMMKPFADFGCRQRLQGALREPQYRLQNRPRVSREARLSPAKLKQNKI